jgi:hypothetical protein
MLPSTIYTSTSSHSAHRTASIHIGRAERFCGNARCKVSQIRAVRPSCVPADDPAPGLTSYDDSDPESPPPSNLPVSRPSTTKIVSRTQEVQDVCASLLLSLSRTSLGRDERRNDWLENALENCPPPVCLAFPLSTPVFPIPLIPGFEGGSLLSFSM